MLGFIRWRLIRWRHEKGIPATAIPLVDLNSTEVQILRFTRALFSLTPSAFLLGEVIV